jgi:hypothetical protein
VTKSENNKESKSTNIEKEKIDPNFIKIFLGISLIILIALGISIVNEKSEAYKTGWNNQVSSLSLGLAGYDSRLTCKFDASIWANNYGLNKSSSEYKDYVQGCSDWRKSGERGLEYLK